MLAEDATFAMPPLASWFGGREEIEIFLTGSPMSGDWDWRAVQTRANGQPALGFYTWNAEEDAYMPFALNVLTFDGEKIKDVTAFIITVAPERRPRGRAPHARAPGGPADAGRRLRAVRPSRAARQVETAHQLRLPASYGRQR